jgi:hypothetical protein
MKTDRSTKSRSAPLTLSSTDEKIISMMFTFRFGGALDAAHYLFSPNSLTYARSRLASLYAAKYLHRFRLPSAKTGGTELIYTLSSRGRDFVANELGLPVDWYYSPGKLKYLSYAQCQHNLLLTRFCVAAHSFCHKQTWLPTGKTDLRLVKMRLCYELARERATVEIVREGDTDKLKVIPDAWLCFEVLKDGLHERFIPVLLEIDRGMEYQQKFKQHLRARIQFILSGNYSQTFGTKAVSVAYATTGERPEYQQTRRAAMCTWSQEVLADLHLENWSHIFHFTSLQFDKLYSTPIFSEPVWYRPDSPEPVRLFASYPTQMNG